MALFSCRGAADTGVTVHAGDVRDAFELDYMNAIIDIWQVLGTLTFQSAAGVDLVARRGPSQCLNSVFEFTLVGGRALAPGRRRRFRPCREPRKTLGGPDAKMPARAIASYWERILSR